MGEGEVAVACVARIAGHAVAATPVLLRPWARPGGDAKTDAIDLRGVSRSFDLAGTKLIVLDGLDLRVPAGQIVAVVGPNGCGKSTLLRVISGLLPADRGSVTIGGRLVSGVDPRVGLVFQEPRLLPWRNVLTNVAFPLELAGVERADRLARARRALELAGLDGFEAAHPAELSGGMAQRAALARALVTDPAVLLLDEPFSALDALTRDRLDVELLDLWRRTGSTIVLVTHSITEAVFMADRVVVMSARPGRVITDVAVDAPRPRDRSGRDAAAFGEAAALVRDALVEEAAA